MKKELIYIVEDNKLYLKFLENSLKDTYTVKGFTSAETCLKAVRNQQPDVMILDYFLPDQNGFEILQQLKDRLKKTRFVILSANKDGQLVLELIRKGIRNYVMKDEEVIENIYQTLYEDNYQY